MSYKQKENNFDGAVTNLDDIPSPYLTGVFDLSDVKSIEIVMARGCSNNCSYCAIHESPLRYFSFERIRSEIEYISENAVKLQEMLVTVADMYENEELGEKVLPLLKEFAERKKVRVLFYVNVSTLNKNKLLKLSNTEYFDVEVGIQSINPKVLTVCHRLPDPDKIKKNILNLQKLAPKAHIYLGLISFLPGDTQDSYLKSLDWAISTGSNVAVNHLRIIPGTELYNKCAARGIKVSPDYPYFVTETDVIPAKDVEYLSHLTTEIFFVLRALSFSKKMEEVYFTAAKRFKDKCPFVSLAAVICKYWRKNADCEMIFKAYEKSFIGTKSLDHDPRTGFISEDDINVLEMNFDVLFNLLKKKNMF